MIYHEKQNGNLCRLHSLNNLFGKLKRIGSPKLEAYIGV